MAMNQPSMTLIHIKQWKVEVLERLFKHQGNGCQ